MNTRILIIGKNSYIGNHIDGWLVKYGYVVDQLDVINEDWRNFDYSKYESIVHVAGIVHQPKCDDWNLYKKVNAEMPIAIAEIAKHQGVKQYIFFSTMGVYGVDKKLVQNVINNTTPLTPIGMYGKSKLIAEEGLHKLNDSSFKVACVRPPSVYGKDCKGNYISGFVSIVRWIPVIPIAYEHVKQSFIYIDNLAELIRLIVENHLDGTFCPQDDRSVSANELFQNIALNIGKRYVTSKFFGTLLRLLKFLPIVRKVYGGIEYSSELSNCDNLKYVIVSFEDGIKCTVS